MTRRSLLMALAIGACGFACRDKDKSGPKAAAAGSPQVSAAQPASPASPDKRPDDSELVLDIK